MARARHRTWLVALALLSLLASSPLFAISPSYVMFYDGQLLAPVVKDLRPGSGSEFLWSPYRSGGEIPSGLEGRPYVKYAIFWGFWREKPTSPNGASQHGRLYLPTASEPGVVVMTPAVMDEKGAVDHPAARPIPEDLADFKFGWVVPAWDMRTAKALGVPDL